MLSLPVNVYVNGAVPPVGATVKLPVDAPLHNTFNELVTATVGGALFATTYVAVIVHEFTSLTITVCVPAVNPETVVPVPKAPPLKE